MILAALQPDAFGNGTVGSGLKSDFDVWLAKNNGQRPHSGRYCYGKTPTQTFRGTRRIALDKIIRASELSGGQPLRPAMQHGARTHGRDMMTAANAVIDR